MKTLLCDMDGCLVDLLPTWLYEYGVVSGDWIHQDTVTAYKHEQFAKNKTAFWAALAPALNAAPPVLGSSAFRRLYTSSEFNTCIVSYCHASVPNAEQIKRAWMQRYFPDYNGKYIFTEHKDMILGDILIEDYAANVEAWSAANPWGQTFLMHTTYNKIGWSWDEIVYALLPESQR